MGISAGDHGSFFLEMEGQFTAILELLSASTTAQAGMESTAAHLTETIVKMERSIDEIRGVELRIQRIATNATIQAVHIGAMGDALNVIAGVMHGLALDSSTNTEAVGGALQKMSEAAYRVSGHSEVELAVLSSAGGVAGEMRSTVVELHSSSECSFSRVTQIAALGAKLAGDIGDVRGGFSAKQLFAQTVTQVCDELERIGAQHAVDPLPHTEIAPAHFLESHAKRYTMQTERDVHESVAAGVAIATAAAEPSRPVLKEGDLGDNVEMF
jgi:hypothetical protein